jgi:hypothetical protein
MQKGEWVYIKKRYAPISQASSLRLLDWLVPVLYRYISHCPCVRVRFDAASQVQLIN